MTMVPSKKLLMNRDKRWQQALKVTSHSTHPAKDGIRDTANFCKRELNQKEKLGILVEGAATNKRSKGKDFPFTFFQKAVEISQDFFFLLRYWGLNSGSIP
jgi:hypothetical protein